MNKSPGIVRKAVGVVSGLLVAVLVLLAFRGAWLWSVTRDLYYVTSTGFYVVLTAFLLVGVAWGFRRGDAAEQVFTGGVALLTTPTGLAAAYYWITGSVIGEDRVATAAGIALIGTLFVLLGLLFAVPYVADKVESTTSE